LCWSWATAHFSSLLKILCTYFSWCVFFPSFPFPSPLLFPCPLSSSF
jgi:hypothetical protein